MNFHINPSEPGECRRCGENTASEKFTICDECEEQEAQSLSYIEDHALTVDEDPYGYGDSHLEEAYAEQQAAYHDGEGW